MAYSNSNQQDLYAVRSFQDSLYNTRNSDLLFQQMQQSYHNQVNEIKPVFTNQTALDHLFV